MWVSFQEPESPKPVLPTCLAVPWSNISERLGLPPIIVHATISLSNWRKIDPEGPFSLSNLTTIFSLDSTRYLKDHAHVVSVYSVDLEIMQKLYHVIISVCVGICCVDGAKEFHLIHRRLYEVGSTLHDL